MKQKQKYGIFSSGSRKISLVVLFVVVFLFCFVFLVLLSDTNKDRLITWYNSTMCELFSDADNKELNYGATDVRWGRKTCDGNAAVLYQGIRFYCA